MLPKSNVIFKRTLLKIKKNVFHRLSSTAVTKKEPIIPVNLSYATYESTQSVTENDPPPLLVMHGLLGSKSNWNSLCKAFHKQTIPQRKVIALDARNHGDSPHDNQHSYEHLVEDVKALCEKLEINKATLLGHSMGGRAMMLLALKYPNLVEKLIVADISPITTSPNLDSMSGLFTALERIQFPNNVPISAARNSADFQLSQMISDRGLRAFLLTNLIQKGDGSFTWRINIKVLRKSFQSHIAVFPDVNALKFEGPVLFIGGGASDFIKKSDHPHIKKLFPKAELKYIEGAGHWLHSERPADFLQICLEFLNKEK